MLKIVVLLSLFLFFIMSFGLAEHVVRFSSESTNITTEPLVQNVFNISINNTDLLITSNITQVNITLPSNLSFIAGSNFTSSGAHTFTNSSNVLSWTNESGLVMNLTKSYFSFNGSSSEPGLHNILITTLNSSGSFQKNLSLIVLEYVRFVSPSNSNWANLSLNYLIVNFTTSPGITVDNFTVFLFNSSGSLINSTTGGSQNFFVNFSSLTNGLYKTNVTVNATNGNNYSSETRTFVLDTISPIVDLHKISSGSSQNALNISITIDESGSGINDFCLVSGNGSLSSVSGSGNNQNFRATGLSCGNSYSYTVNCTDYAGNVGSKTKSFSTSACNDSSSTTSTGSPSLEPPASFWTNTFIVSPNDFISGYTKSLRARERIRIVISGNDHYVGIISTNATSAVINVSSTPQQAIMTVGETRNFEVNGDNFYDLLVLLNNVNSTMANITVRQVNSSIVEEMFNISSNRTSRDVSQEKGKLNLSSLWWIFLILGLILIGALIAYLKWRTRQKFKGLSVD